MGTKRFERAYVKMGGEEGEGDMGEDDGGKGVGVVDWIWGLC